MWMSLQHNIDRLNIWFKTNGLHLNVARCNVLSFALKHYLEDVTLDSSYTFNDLGS